MIFESFEDDKVKLIAFVRSVLLGAFRSYSICLFSKKNSVGLLVLLSTMIYPMDGLTTFLFLILTNFFALLLGFNKSHIESGFYGVSPLFLLLSLLTTYEISWQLLSLMLVGCVFTLFMTTAITRVMQQFILPALSLPFILSYWAVFVSAGHYKMLNLAADKIFFRNDFFGYQSPAILEFYVWISEIDIPLVIAEYFYSLSAIFLQANIVSGAVIALALMIQSRITFLLSLIGFMAGFYYYQFVIGDITQISYGLIGYNYILVSIALGGFFFVPTRSIFMLTLLSTPITSMLAASLFSVAVNTGLPVFSLPYIVTVYLILYGLSHTFTSGVFKPVNIFQYSPETALYHERAEGKNNRYSRLMAVSLPFFGEWKVTQDDNGNITHKGDWRHAWDFSVERDGSTWKYPGKELTDFYSYDLPVLSPAEGWISEIAEGIPDNAVGDVNIEQNWGNTVVIYHAPGLYSQISHLKPDSVLYPVGTYVARGTQIAQLGNSGRSPEPHIHLQFQATPAIGSKPFPFPLKNYISTRDGKQTFIHAGFPKTGEMVKKPELSEIMSGYFNWLPGKNIEWEIEKNGKKSVRKWEICTDAFNQTYVHCLSTNSVAYFYNYGSLFRFQTYYGDRSSELFTFFLTCRSVVLISSQDLTYNEFIPQYYGKKGISSYIQDFIAPFYCYNKIRYEFLSKGEDHPLAPSEIRFETKVTSQSFGKSSDMFTSEFVLGKERFREISVNGKNYKLTMRQTK